MLSLTTSISAQSSGKIKTVIKQVFKKVPPPTQSALADIDYGELVERAMIRPIVNAPTMLVEMQEDRWQQSVLTAAGFGFSYQELEYEEDHWRSALTIAPATLLLSATEDYITPYYAGYVGLWGNSLILGGAKKLVDDKGWYLLGSFGYTF